MFNDLKWFNNGVRAINIRKFIYPSGTTINIQYTGTTYINTNKVILTLKNISYNPNS